LVKDFLVNNVTILKHPLYSPDVASADFYLLPPLKVALKGRRFCVGAFITKGATEEVKMLSRDGFHECSQHLYSRWQKLILAHEDYFEGNVA
jgi:hypothetical protein